MKGLFSAAKTWKKNPYNRNWIDTTKTMTIISVYILINSHYTPHDVEPCAMCVATSWLFCRVLDAVDAADHLLLRLCFPSPPHQAEDAAGAETEGDQPDRLQRGLHIPILHAGPQYVCSNSLPVRGRTWGHFVIRGPDKLLCVLQVNLFDRCEYSCLRQVWRVFIRNVEEARFPKRVAVCATLERELCSE